MRVSATPINLVNAYCWSNFARREKRFNFQISVTINLFNQLRINVLVLVYNIQLILRPTNRGHEIGRPTNGCHESDSSERRMTHD